MSMTEKKDFAVSVPLPHGKSGSVPLPHGENKSPAAAVGESPAAAEQSFFRGEPIAWLTVPTTKTVITENAFGDSEASERPAQKNHFILYGGNQYKREGFYQMAFP